MKRISEDFLVVSCDGCGDAYVGTLRGIQQNGSIVVSRGLETKEIRPAMFIFNNPRERFLTCPGRNIHPFFQILESIYILGGRGDVAWISKYLQNMEKYSDGEDQFHAPYGKRMRRVGDGRSFQYDNRGFHDQFEHCYRYLDKDPDTRHAVMTFWDPVLDFYKVKTIDRPCNVGFHFLIRDGKLDLTIFCRSNDIHFGLFNANVVQFSVMLESMAMLLGVPVGKQIHMINSLHYYTDNSLTEEVLSKNKEETNFNMYKYVRPHPFGLRNEAGIDPWNLFNECFEEFFRDEEAIWKGHAGGILSNNFSYLRDALYVARAFWHIKHKNLRYAFDDLCEIKANDIFITTAEFFARELSPDAVLDYSIKLRQKFDLKNKHEIVAYILTH